MRTHNRSFCRGTTLVEILISATIFMVFLSMVFGLYLLGYNSWKRADTKMQTKREAVIAMEEISRGLSHTNERSVKVVYYFSLAPFKRDFANPPAQTITADYCAISFLTAQNDEGTFVIDSSNQDPLWQAYLVYYVDPADGTLRKKRIPLPPGATTPNMTDEQKEAIGFGNPLSHTDLIACLDGEGKILAKDIKRLRMMDILTEPPIAIKDVFNPLCVQIRVEKVSVKEEAPEVMELTRLMRMYE